LVLEMIMNKLLIILIIPAFLLGGVSTYFFLPHSETDNQTLDSQIQSINQIQSKMVESRTNNVAEDNVFKQGITELAKLKTDDNTQLLLLVGNQWAENSELRKTNEKNRQILKTVAEALDEYSKKVRSYPVSSYPTFTQCRSNSATSSVDCFSY